VDSYLLFATERVEEVNELTRVSWLTIATISCRFYWPLRIFSGQFKSIRRTCRRWGSARRCTGNRAFHCVSARVDGDGRRHEEEPAQGSESAYKIVSTVRLKAARTAQRVYAYWLRFQLTPTLIIRRSLPCVRRWCRRRSSWWI